MPAYAGCFRPPNMLKLSIYIGRWRCRSCKLLARPSDASRSPPSASGLSAAARRYGVLPMPSLEWNEQVAPRDRAALRARREGGAVGRVAVLRALCEGDQCAQEGAQRRHPGAQLPDAGNLQLRRRFRRRSACSLRAKRPRSTPTSSCSAACTSWPRPSKILNPGQDRADPRSEGRLLARLLDHRRGRAAACAEIPRRAGGRLCQHVGRREGRGRHLLHLVECHRGGREPRRRHRDLPARSVSGEIRRRADQDEDHRLEGRLRGARALHRR